MPNPRIPPARRARHAPDARDALDDEREVVAREHRAAIRALIKAVQRWSEETARGPRPAHWDLRCALDRVNRARNVEQLLGVIDADEYDEMTDEERSRFATGASADGEG